MNKILLRRSLWVVLLSTLAVTLQAQSTRYVKQGGTGDGSNWVNASGDLQAMMNAAANGGTVYVAGGTYYPTTSTDRTLPFLVPQAGNIKMLGGYNAATGIRNITANPTILSGDIGVTGNRADNSYHVLVIAGTDANADSIIIDGFTVTKGQADGGGQSTNYNATGIQTDYGGGICVVVGGKVAIRNTIISDNKARFGGGGMFNHYSSPLIEDCSVVSNELIHDNNYLGYEYYGGGGIYNKYSDPQINRTSIKLNKGFNGAGLLNYSGSPKYNNSLFDGNIAANEGGATYNFSYTSYEQSLPIFTNCVFTNNRAGLGGAGYDTYKSSPTYTNCVFYSNSALGSSGYGYGSCFYGDRSEFLTINNCVFSGNVTSVDQTIRLLNSSIRMRNSIMYGNTSGTDIYIANSSNSQIGNSLLGSVVTTSGATINYLTGNLIGSYDPQFANAANAVGADGNWGTADDGLQLKSISPAINAGSNSLVPGGITTDITGAQRIQAGAVDMGAYESAVIINCAFSTLYVDGTNANSGQGDSWANAFKTLSEAMERARYCINVNTIMVAKGTYYATGDQGGSNRDSAFLIPQRGGIKIYGGYPNGGGTRNINAYPTILSGDIGVPGNNSDNSYHVLVMTGTTPGADSVVVDGFTITGANANGNNYYYNNVLTNQNEGGGVLFRNNVNASSKIAIRNCNIINNNAGIWGAGIYTLESSALISNCVIANNTATEGGGGFFSYDNASPRLVNCLLSGNSAKNGAAVYNSGSSLTIVNSTFSGNTASIQGSGIYNTGTSNSSVANTILWNNGTNNIYNSAVLNITYSNVEQSSGVYSGIGNINANPLFVNSLNATGSDGNWRTADDGLKLQNGSTAINIGTPDVSGLSLNAFDLQEGARILAGRIDMGAYESPFINCSQASNVLYVDGAVSQSGNGIGWATALKTLTEALDALNGCPDINTILLAKGTYYPSASLNRDDAFVIPQRGNVKIYGGYPTGGGARDVLANPTILSGDIGAVNNNADNSYHVMVITNINTGADSVIVDGLTFTNAHANGSGNNRTTGGGLLLLNTNNNSKIAIRNCRFINNRATQGAGIYISASSPRIINSYVQGNFSTDNGGGISNYNGATPTLANVVISGNQASFAGAVFNDNSSPTFINSTIADNYASGDAGGFYNRYSGTNVNFFNSIIYGNKRPDGSPSNIFNTSSGKATLAYSLIESTTGTWDPAFGTDNGNNKFADPLFVAQVTATSGNTPNTLGNYQLQAASAVIDAGNNASIPLDISTDIANATRLQHAWVDLGAFESPYFNCSMFTATTSQTDVKCHGDATGIASVTLNRGEAPYAYNWSNGATTAINNNIVAGNYTCTITDVNGCTINKAFTITQPVAPLSANASSTNIKCFGDNNGSAAINVTGGTAPYSYSWSNGSTAANLTALTPGTYNYTVIDANGCTVTGAVTITQPAAQLTATTAQTNVICTNTNAAAASVQVSGGTSPYSYLWSTGASGDAISNLTAGTYTCTITDGNGCSIAKPIIISQSSSTLTLTSTQTNVLCYNNNTGSVTLTINGGTVPYTYNWSNGETTSTINNLAPGNYTCTVTDANGCVISKAFTITAPNLLTVQVISKTDMYCGAGSTGLATIQANGGVTPYVYQWSNGSSTPAVTALAVGTYSCVVSDANGCTANTSVNIAQKSFTGNKIYVDSAIAVGGDGSSWTSAFRYLSDAMVAADCPGVDSILVAKGTYYPTGTPAGVNRDSTFLIRQSGGLKIVGGYPSGGGVRDIGTNATILSGDIGSASEFDNSYHVMVIAGTAPGADSVVIDGFVVKRGYAGRAGVYYYNGVEVSQQYGSAIHLNNNNDVAGKISIRNCQFNGNASIYKGGAIYNEQSSPVIAHCKFFGNIANGSGGAIHNELLSNPLITLCEFSNNEALEVGGAIFNAPNTYAIIDQCRILSNFGGGIGNESSSPVIKNSYIAGNWAYYIFGGGGIYNNNASPRIINTYFIGNMASNVYGGGLGNFNNSSVTVTNCTFSGNSGWQSTGPIYNDASQVSITNSISYGNDGGGVQDVNGSTTSVNYSLIEYWRGGGTGNLSHPTDPMFIAWGYSNPPFTDGDYRLRACSPAINAGTVDTTGLNLPAFAMLPQLPRVQLGRIDMGAYEANSYTNANTGAIPETFTSTAAYQLRDSTTWYATSCDSLIAAITGSGSDPLNGNTTVSVNKEVTLLPGTVSRFYEITPQNNPGTASGTITLYYTQAEFTAYNLANNIKLLLPDKDDAQVNNKIPNVRIRKVSGAVQTTIIPQTVYWNDGAQRWELTFNVAGFGKFYVFTEIDAALPLRLINFAAKEENCMANITWTTAEEAAVSHYNLEQSSDGISYTTLAQIKARNTSGENRYNTSISINATINFYRLKMVDVDGNTTYSKIAKLIPSPDCIAQAIRLYPNPAHDVVYIENARSGEVYNLYDNTGRLLLQGTIKKVIQEIDVKNLVPGAYAVYILNKKGATRTMKFIKQ